MELPLEKLRRFCKEEGIAYMGVFGSVAGGTARSNSDVDILVSFVQDEEIGLLHFIGVKQRLEDLLGKRVDLVSKKALNPYIKEDVLNHLKEIYSYAA